MKLREAIEEWIVVRAVEADVGFLTIRGYRSNLRTIFKPFLDMDIQDVTVEHLNVATVSYKARLNPVSWPVRLSTCRLFSQWAVDSGLWSFNYYKRMRARKPSARLPLMLDTPEDVLAIAAHFDPLKIHDMRDRAMFLTQYDGALRAQELLDLRKTDFLPSRHPTEIHIKGIKREADRYVVIWEEATQAIEEYLSFARSMILAGRKDPGHLFVGSGGGKVSYDSWRRSISAICEAAGIPFKVTSHTLRNSQATFLARGGMSVWKLKDFLGHENVLSTAKYVHMIERDIIDSYVQIRTEGRKVRQ